MGHRLKATAAARPEARKAQPQSHALLHRAIALLSQGDLAAAELALEPLCKGWQPDTDALHFLGILRHRQGRTDEGIALVRRSLALQPRNASALINLGNLMVETAQSAPAIDCYRKAVACATEDGQTADAWANIAALLRRSGATDDARHACERALALRPDHASAWYTLSQALAEQGDALASVQAYQRAAKTQPALHACRAQVLRALMQADARPQAAELLREWLQQSPGNPVAAHLLEACEGRTPSRASDDYVSQMFDSYAATFDASLERLHYRAPQCVADAVRTHVGEPTGALDIADAGCGTGLVAPLLRPWARYLSGFDLSAGMLREAQRRGGYDDLAQAELMHHLRAHPDAFDLVVSADTLCYFGDLHEALQAAATALRPGGFLVFTVEALEGAPNADTAAGQPFRLELSGRYTHTQEHLRAALAAAGFIASQIDAVVPRQEGGLDVAGWLVTARLPDAERLHGTPPRAEAPDLKAPPFIRSESGDSHE